MSIVEYMLLQIKNLKKKYGLQVVLDGINVSISEKQRIGVVGRNGAGKSTLFRIVTNQERADDGEVTIYDQARIGYLRQDDDFLPDEIVADYLARTSGRDSWECARIASKFCLKEKELKSKITDLSGGYQMRVKLSAMLLRDPNLLLLDEPTNYLDMSTMLLLEDFLLDYKGAFLIISHDRRFLESVCSETLEIERGRAQIYPGKLCQYEKFKADQLKNALKFNKKQDKKEKHLQAYVDRFRYKASKAAQAQAKVKQIAKIEKLEIAQELSNVRINIPKTNEKKGLALRVENLTIGYRDKIIASDIDFDIEGGEHIAILGDNGEGKSTFFKTIAGLIEARDGNFRWMANTRVAYYAQHVSDALNPKEQVGPYLESVAIRGTSNEDIMRMAGNFLFSPDDLEKHISMLSGGERARLCLAGILLRDYNVFLLDEPNNHLDFSTVEALGRALKETKSTVLFISHDQTFVSMLADSIIEVGGGQVRRFSGNYENYIEVLRKRVDLGIRSEKVSDQSDVKEEKRKIYEEEKRIKREMEKLEKKQEKLETRKVEILTEFEKNPTVYDEKLCLELREIEEEIKVIGEEWGNI